MDIVDADAASVTGSAVRADRIAELYARHAPGAFGFALVVCGSREAADDAVQEAFERVMGRLGDIRAPDAFAAYLRRTVLNVLRARGRSDQRQRDREEAHVRNLTVGGTYRGDAVDPDGRLWSALQALPERQRAALVCRFWLDLSERDTARVLGCRPGTVKSSLSRGLASIREVMSHG
jgi:RNA polymerase sigma factor (sigma-70 family)